MIQSMVGNVFQQPRKWVLLLVSAIAIVIVIRLLFDQHSSGGNNSIANTHFFRKLKKSKEPSQAYAVMITGGAGFIGSHIAEHFIKNEPLCQRIVIYDNLHSTAQSTGNPNVETNSNLEMLYSIDSTKKIVFVKASIMDRQKLRETLQAYQIRFIYHLAALISVPESMSNPKIYFDINTIGTDIVLDEARATGHVKKVVLSSSAAIYGFDPTVPKMENMNPSCESPYAQSKYDGEFLCKFHSQQALENSKDGEPMVAIALRYFNVFGERQDPNSQYAAAIPRFIDRACKQNEAIEVFGDGRQTRDFVYVKDVVWANVYASFYIGEFGVFNVGYGSYITINQLADLVESECSKLSGKPAKKRIYKPKRAGDVSASMASVRRLTNNGWTPKYNFKESAIQTIQYFYQQGKQN
ncbi:dTDP-glucose 4,6-dehydratase [Naegleria gruberi]|uniref:dTDP-glucose 4,6-dehydratase n=1 Tax=Naegleria gruberi TaxID=5762 RepID=D2V598_NAEGR|nr:dTDP-glucose 4,6-dehydratase [Naegleria gruberi]EFC48237.1 dTDP-glucose 4,6-dehydratase [Naegleria gruberi]|eukprot:XP_002680981.1 dTDP-glucose 4,6-dehydratase [Naegleria gruberi strain NEG-M]